MGDWGMHYETGRLIVKIRESPLSPITVYSPPKNVSGKLERRRAPNVMVDLSNRLHAAVFSRDGNDLNVEYVISIREV
jgi:hypothetical protein